MTPAARVAAAIEILDAVLSGQATEQALTRWARSSRFAGSKDRAAVRDLVFAAQRRRLSCFAHVSGCDGRAWMIGHHILENADLDAVFSGVGHAPAPIEASEILDNPQIQDYERSDIPQWLWPRWTQDLGPIAKEIAQNLCNRAPVFLRANLAKTNRDEVISALQDQGYDAQPHPEVVTAIEVRRRSAGLTNCAAFEQGLFEFQDASSQNSVTVLAPATNASVLDYCAGGGGKSLALAAWVGGAVDAHDVHPNRLKPIPERTRRAGVSVRVLHDVSQINYCYDVVFCDVPCSGSGTWRRDPEGKWSLTKAELDNLNKTQDGILQKAAKFVKPSGTLVYATCSVLTCENMERLDHFIKNNPEWVIDFKRQNFPNELGDGFFVARLTQKQG